VILTAGAVTFGIIVITVLLCAPRSVPGDGPEWREWQRQQRVFAGQSGIRRLYHFQDATAATGRFANHAGLTSPLASEFQLPEKAEGGFSLVEGRWPWKQAVRLRHGTLHSRLSVPSDRAFTFHAWMRHFGEADPADSFYGTVCSVMSMGDGVNNGWCLQLVRPCNMLLFCMGQPKGETAIALSSHIQLPEQVWTPVAGTWDGEHLRLYIRGMLCASAPFRGQYAAPAAHSRFRLGVAGNGSLAACVEFDEVALFDRCLSDEEVLKLAWPELPADEESLLPLITAGQQLIDRRMDDAESLLQPNDPLAKPSPLLQTLVRFRLAEVLPHVNRAADAQVQLERITGDMAAPEALRLAAIHETILLKHGVQPPLPISRNAERPDQWSLCRTWEGHQSTVDDYRKALQDFAAERWLTDYSNHIRPLLTSRCGACHQDSSNPDKFFAARLEGAPAVANSAALWEQAAGRIREGQMPPAGHPTLTSAERSFLERWWSRRPAAAFCELIPTEGNQSYYPGFVRNRRLTRLEYRNAIRDLLGVDLQPDELPPGDASGGEGFDNVGDVLFTSPSHLDAWMRSTGTAINRALKQDLQASRNEERRVLSEELLAAIEIDKERPRFSVARPLIETFVSRAWRRAPQPAEIASLQKLYESAEISNGDGEELKALELTMQAILLSPHFLFVVETRPPDKLEVVRLTADELATRLALLLWSSIPDDPLRESARSGKLLLPSELRQQLQRMLADPRSRALGESFGVQWLGLDEASDRRPDSILFPEYTPELAASFREEAIRTVAGIFQKNLPITELLASDAVWVDSELAAFYGVTQPVAEAWERVSAGDSHRGGVAALGAVLTTTSYTHRTSPVLRGKWLLQNLLGESIEPPPAGIPSLENADVGSQPPTMRARLEAHRRNPDCAGCHEVMDPLGFSLEQFDPIGRWRTEADGLPVDATGTLPDGTSVIGHDGLKHALLRRQEEFHRHFTRKLIGYALGRGLTQLDDCLVESCLARLRKEDFAAQGLLEEIVQSFAFQHRYVMASPNLP
jgi:hypothetical protein